MGGFNTGLGKAGGPKFNAGTGGGFDTGLGPKRGGIKGAPPSRLAIQRHGGGHGFSLGSVGHWIGSKLSLAGHDIEQIPGGTYHLVKAALPSKAELEHPLRFNAKSARKQWGEFLSHPVRSYHDTAHGKFGKEAQNAALQAGGVVGGIKHTIEHPLADPFQTAMISIPAVSGLGKLGEAAGIKAFAEGPRTLRMGEKDVNLIPSRNPSLRAAQRGYDRVVQGAMNKEQSGAQVGRLTQRVAQHGVNRVKGAIAEEERAAQRMRDVPANMLDQAASRLNLGKLPRQAREHQAAMELTSTQTLPHEAALYHEHQAELGINPEQNAAVAKLYRRVEKRNLVHFDPNRPEGDQVHINPEHKLLAHTDAQLAHVGREGDTRLIEHGQMTPEGTQTAINNPGRVRAGAEYTNPTPARMGVESPVLKELKRRLAIAEKGHAKAAANAMGRVNNMHSVMHRFASREMTDAEAQARLAELDRQHAELANKLVPHVSPYDNPAAEQLRRNEISGKVKKGKNTNGVSKPTETVKEEQIRLAEEKMREMAQKHAGNGMPWADALQKLISERDQLRHTLQARADAPIFGHEPPPLPHVAGAGYHYQMPWEHDPQVQRLSGAISYLKDQIQKEEARAAGRIEPVGLHGGENARMGRTHISYRTSEKTAAQAPAVRFTNKVTGRAASPISSHEFTGEGIRHGLVPNDVTGMKSRAFRQITRHENTVAQRDTIWHTGSEVSKGTGHEVLLANPEAGATLGKIAPEIRQAINQEAPTFDKAHELSAQEAAAATAEGVKAALEARVAKWLDQSHVHAGRVAGLEATSGYRWVDERLLQGLQDMIAPRSSRGRDLGAKVGRGFDNINSAVTTATVYTKVGHVFTRGITNAVTNMMQGSLDPLEVAKTWKFEKDAKASLGEKYNEFRQRLLAAAGQMGYSALPHEGTEGLVGRSIATAARKGSGFWARRFDAPFRINALMYELRRAGYNTPEEVAKALDGIQHGGKGLAAHEWSKLSAAFRRADREAISYDRLSGWERNFMGRIFWFYPWVKGSTMFTLRSTVEHPYKMGALAAIGAQGRREQTKGLGPVPSYEQGLIDLGGKHNPETVDMGTFSPFSTAGQLANMPEVPGAVAQMFNPATGAAVEAATGTNQYGEPSNNRGADILSALAAATPEFQLYEAFGRRGKNSSRRMFPGMTPGAEVKRYLLGPGIAERRVNKAALAKAARREHAKRYTVYSGG